MDFRISRIRLYRLLACLLSCLFILDGYSQHIFVSPTGSDKNTGSKQAPVKTFARAQSLARNISKQKNTIVEFAKGIYYLDETVTFNSADSKQDGNTVTYRSAVEGGAIISGGQLLKLHWKPYKNKIMVADVPRATTIDQLYINGIRQRMARYPNAIPGKNVFDTWDLDHDVKKDSTTDVLTSGRNRKWKNPAGGYLHTMHEYLWGDMHWIIKGKNADGSLSYEGGWQNNRPSNMHPVYRMVENIFEELDTAGEWYFDQQQHRLYCIPAEGADLKKARTEIVKLRELVKIVGSENAPVNGINLEGFVFRHAARTFMDNKEPLLRSDWTVYRGGAVMMTGAINSSIVDCEFDQVGGNAVFINNYNRNIRIEGCYIHDAGANGIAFVGDPAMVRSPLFRYGKQDYEHLDTIAGAKGKNYPSGCEVINCLITKTGRDEKQTAGVHISMSHAITVSNCSIYDLPRAGININEGTFGGHLIEYCDVFNTVLETGDHGSFNSWGRDRYWTPDVKETSTQVSKNPAMPGWDMLEKNIIRNSRWRCDHGWDIDLDDGSSNYLIENNLLLNGGLKLREGYYRTATNNIIINNGLHPHVWYQASGDVFMHNIVFKAYQPAIMDQVIGANGKWGKRLDSNFYATGVAEMKQFLINGCDSNSVNGDPLFVAAANGDYRLKENSPVYRTGFQNFRQTIYGVTKPSLRKIAKNPETPAVLMNAGPDPAIKTDSSYSWMNIVLWEPKGAALSAFGISLNAGGVAFNKVQEGSDAHRLGFRSGDLVTAINGQSTGSIIALQNILAKLQSNRSANTVTLIRNQEFLNIVMTAPLPLLSAPAGSTR